MAHKIDTENAVATMPVAAAAGTPGWFTDADPLNPTHLDADWCNSQQAAVTTTVEDSGESLDKADINQFSRIVSGVHAIMSEIRSTVASVKNSTVAKMALIASRLSSVGGDRSAVIASDDCDIASASTHEAACVASKTCAIEGYRTAAVASANSSVTDEEAAVVASDGCTVGGRDAATVGCFNTTVDAGSKGAVALAASDSRILAKAGAAVMAAYHAIQSANLALLLGSYCENVDENCLAGGHGTSAPADHGDGLTNKNIKWKLHSDSGNAEFEGDVTAGGTFGGPADAPLPVTKRALTASVDWATSAAEIEGSPVVSYEDSTEVEITLTIANSDSGPHDVEMGSTVLMDISGIQATGGTLISAFAHTTAGSTNAQKGLRWSCGIMLNSSGNPKLAVTSVGKATAAIAGSGAESVTVKIYLTFAALKAV